MSMNIKKVVTIEMFKLFYPILARFCTRATMTFYRTRHIPAFARTTSGSIFLSFYTARTLAITAISLRKQIFYGSVKFVYAWGTARCV